MKVVTATSQDDSSMAVRVAALVPWMQRRASQLDEIAGFPVDEIAALGEAGALAMQLPIDRVGAEKSENRGVLADRLASVLVQIGFGNLAVGRIVEAHMNSRHLISRYGSAEQRAASATDVRDGHLYALWVTDPPAGGLRMAVTSEGIRLIGHKVFCSAAGFATKALVTAVNEDGGSQMLVVDLGNGERVEQLESPLQGMRAAVTGAVDFTGCMAAEDQCLGNVGDYLREPDFSAGAWRGSAVALGGLCSLIELTKAQLKAAERLGNPHQLQRMGTAMIACETSRLWLRQVAQTAEDPDVAPARAIAYVGLARIAIETACLDAMQLVQRSLGLSAFRRGNPVERICRDLGTYLRQPAPDEVLTQAAVYYARQTTPEFP
jgi:alkylation response protein AidB-like acyl-CoA dehydrogenase